MTMLVSWIGKDSNGESSLYIGTDSRRSRANSSGVLDDEFRKTFISEDTPDIFGVFGEADQTEEFMNFLTPQLGPIRDALGHGNLLNDYMRRIRNAIESFSSASSVPLENFTLLHGSRISEMDFRLLQYDIQITPTATRCYSAKEAPLTDECGLRYLGASGRGIVSRIRQADPETDAREYSRWQWQTFYAAIATRPDPHCGGAPQLVAIYRGGNGRMLGVSFQNSAYRGGSKLTGVSPSTEEYRDQLFQRVDQNGNLLAGAQRHARNPRKAIVSPIDTLGPRE